MTAAATNDSARPARLPGIASAPALWLGAACFLVHLVANAHYDVFRDELYFIVCGLHPAFGYVDQPPLIPLIAAASYKLFGTALTPLRFVPALASAATVALTADLADGPSVGRDSGVLAEMASGAQSRVTQATGDGRGFSPVTKSPVPVPGWKVRNRIRRLPRSNGHRPT